MNEQEDNMATMLAELRDFRKEHSEASKETRETLARVDITLKEMKECVEKIKLEMKEVQLRVSGNKDSLHLQERSVTGCTGKCN